jgi:hypothetical protein
MKSWPERLSAAVAEDERHHGHDQKDDEQDFGDTGSTSGNATKTKGRCDERNNEENEGVVQHGGLLIGMGSAAESPRLVVTATPIAAMNSV